MKMKDTSSMCRRLKKSPYILMVSIDSNTVLASNLLTGEVLKITKKEADMLINGIPDSKDIFIKSGYLISEPTDIQKYAIQRHREACNYPAIFNLTLLPTLSCNFSCSYCFEKGANPKTINEDITDRILKFIKFHAPYHLRTDLAWFGGEPLLAKDYIAKIHPKISEIVVSSKKEFISNITTNGYLLDQDAVKLLRELNIKFVQITLDGNKSVHDQNRKTKDGKGTFDKIFENIITFLDIFEKGIITLRVNAVNKTIGSILHTLNKIPLRFRNRVSLHLHHVMHAKCPKNFSDKFSDNIKEIYKKIRLLGYNIAVDYYLDPGPSVYCYAERATSAVIDPEGYIFKCAYTNFSDKERIGFLDKEGRIKLIGTFESEWKNLVSKEPDKCMNCIYLPICGFGCPRLRLNSFLKNNDCKNRFKFLPDTLTALK